MYSTNYLIAIFLFGHCVAVPLVNNTSWIKDLMMSSMMTNVVENSSIPTVPLEWHFKGKHYYLGTILKANYFESEQFCNYHGMRLISISSKEENDFLGQKLYDSGMTDLFWTSGTRLQDDKNWIWMTTGARIEFTNWAPGEPSNKNGVEKCLEVNRYRIPHRKYLFWNDQDCASKLHFICEHTKPKSTAYVISQLNKLLDFNETRIVPEE